MKQTLLAIASASIVLTGCGAHQAVVRAEKTHAVTETSVDTRVKAAEARVKERTVEGDSEVSRPWLAGASVPLAREVTLPPALRKGVNTTLLFKGSDSVDLMQAAAQLTAAIKIPVRVRPDALMPQADFLPRTQGAVAAPSKELQRVNMRLQGDMDAAEILNYIAAQTGVSWEYKADVGVIELYRLVTRTLEFKAALGTTSVELGLGRSGGQGAAFTASSSTKLAIGDFNPVTDLKVGIEAMLTRAGSGTIGGGVVVVTDTKEAVDRVTEFVARENKMAGRKVRMIFEAVEVSSNDTAEAGIDWNLVYKKIAQGTTGDLTSTLGLNAVKSLASDQAGALSLGVLGNSRFNGSDVVLNALKDVGTVVSHTKAPLQTTNKRPVQYAVRTTFDYVSQVEVTASASAVGTTSTPAIKQKEESIGTTLTITPAAFDDGQIMLSISYDSTTLRSLKPYSVGTSSTNSPLSTVQQRTIDGSGALQIVQVRPGQTVLISGFERGTDTQDKRRLDENAPLLFGGSDRATKTKTSTLLLVTAVAED